MRLTRTQNIESVLFQRVSNAPVVIITEWREGKFGHSSNFTLDQQIAEKAGLLLTPDLAGDMLEFTLELEGGVLDENAIEDRKEIVILNQVGCTEVVSPRHRAKHYYASFVSPQRKNTVHLGMSYAPAYPLYSLVISLLPEEYETLAEMLAMNGGVETMILFIFTFAHKDKSSDG